MVNVSNDRVRKRKIKRYQILMALLVVLTVIYCFILSRLLWKPPQQNNDGTKDAVSSASTIQKVKKPAAPNSKERNSVTVRESQRQKKLSTSTALNDNASSVPKNNLPSLVDADNPFASKQQQRKHANITISQKVIPDFKEGGLVFFLHVPKTGGSTIRLALEEHRRFDYAFVPGRGIWDSVHPFVDRYVSSKPPRRRRRKIAILEVHGRDAPHLLELLPQLKAWKKTAAEHQIPTFFFTILREPTSYAISYFNFFHVQRKSPLFENVQPTESNFRRLMLWNPQCQFMARGENSLRDKKVKQKPTIEECDHVHQSLYEIMDWVGTVDRLSQETLPLLSQILNTDVKNFEPKLVADRDPSMAIRRDQLSESTMNMIHQMSFLDARLYDSVRSMYGIGMWTNFVNQSSSTMVV